MPEMQQVVTLRLTPQAYDDHCECEDDSHQDCEREYKPLTVVLAVGGSAWVENGTEEGVGVEVLSFGEDVKKVRCEACSKGFDEPEELASHQLWH